MLNANTNSKESESTPGNGQNPKPSQILPSSTTQAQPHLKSSEKTPNLNSKTQNQFESQIESQRKRKSLEIDDASSKNPLFIELTDEFELPSRGEPSRKKKFITQNISTDNKIPSHGASSLESTTGSTTTLNTNNSNTPTSALETRTKQKTSVEKSMEMPSPSVTGDRQEDPILSSVEFASDSEVMAIDESSSEESSLSNLSTLDRDKQRVTGDNYNTSELKHDEKAVLLSFTRQVNDFLEKSTSLASDDAKVGVQGLLDIQLFIHNGKTLNTFFEKQGREGYLEIFFRTEVDRQKTESIFMTTILQTCLASAVSVVQDNNSPMNSVMKLKLQRGNLPIQHFNFFYNAMFVELGFCLRNFFQKDYVVKNNAVCDSTISKDSLQNYRNAKYKLYDKEAHPIRNALEGFDFSALNDSEKQILEAFKTHAKQVENEEWRKSHFRGFDPSRHFLALVEISEAIKKIGFLKFNASVSMPELSLQMLSHLPVTTVKRMSTVLNVFFSFLVGEGQFGKGVFYIGKWNNSAVIECKSSLVLYMNFKQHVNAQELFINAVLCYLGEIVTPYAAKIIQTQQRQSAPIPKEGITEETVKNSSQFKYEITQEELKQFEANETNKIVEQNHDDYNQLLKRIEKPADIIGEDRHLKGKPIRIKSYLNSNLKSISSVLESLNDKICVYRDPIKLEHFFLIKTNVGSETLSSLLNKLLLKFADLHVGCCFKGYRNFKFLFVYFKASQTYYEDDKVYAQAVISLFKTILSNAEKGLSEELSQFESIKKNRRQKNGSVATLQSSENNNTNNNQSHSDNNYSIETPLIGDSQGSARKSSNITLSAQIKTPSFFQRSRENPENINNDVNNNNASEKNNKHQKP